MREREKGERCERQRTREVRETEDESGSSARLDLATVKSSIEPVCALCRTLLVPEHFAPKNIRGSEVSKMC